MTTFARIEELGRHEGATVTVRGWCTHLRSSGKIAFIVLRDGTGTLQCVLVKKEVDEGTWGRFAELTLETSVAVTGAVRADARAPGGYELGVSGLEIVGASPLDYPIQPKEHGVDFLLDNRHRGCARRASGPSRGCGTRWSRGSTTSSTSAASCGWIPPS